ncbi:MAG: hypothetical protein CVV44_01030 [Spirochaetae bacterium HGW-Spirochaetae-1]|nr:MAG: hypothetical protein CVV44_01030 [Spirochaetae bacterium HGW-Spirochaetae-1]
MNTKCKPTHLLILFMAMIISACGMDSPASINISGTVSVDTAEPVTGPVFLLFTDTADFEAIKAQPLDHVITMISCPDNGSYSLDLAEHGVRRNDTVYITAILDVNYDGGVPYPDPGDYIGFYINSETMQPSRTMQSDNRNIDITINRLIYDYQASIEGTITNALTGTVTLIAYAGSVDSLDITSLDMDKIMGYGTVTKTGESVDYSLDIMPFGRNVPMDDVYVFALFDLNNDGIPNAGDALAFYADGATGVPLQCVITQGPNSGINITGQMELMSSSDYAMTIDGYFEHPEGYDSSSKPVFIMIAHTDDPGALFTDPLSVVKAFKKLDPGMSSFSIDLSTTDLEPGDEVMVIALWDKDYSGGFPSPTAGDMVGYYQNTDLDNFAFTIALAESGPNTAYHQASGDWKFQLNKKMYDYNTTVEFQLDPSSRPAGMVEGNSLICLVVHDDGVNNLTRNIDDINYVTGMALLPYVADPNHHYSFPLFAALDEGIAVTLAMNSYVYVLYDRDNNGMPSSGDNIAAYWENNFFTAYQTAPKKIQITSDENNFLLGADDGTKDPYGVRFIGKTY